MTGRAHRRACNVCDGMYEAVSYLVREASRLEPGEVELDSERCPACVSLGADPPKSPCCGERLSFGDSIIGPLAYVCRGCDAHFTVDCLRLVLLSDAAVSALRAYCGSAGDAHHRMIALAEYILSRARKLKVI